MDQCNGKDLEAYVERRFKMHGIHEDEELLALGDQIVCKSSGIFLWAKLVLDMLLSDFGGGKTLGYMRERLNTLPRDLEAIYRDMLSAPGMSDEERWTAVRFFQWVVFSARPFRLRECYAILGLIQRDPLRSLKWWTSSTNYPGGEEQLENWIRRVSRGLVEVSRNSDLDALDNDSIILGPGSLCSDFGETRTVQVIHSSVITFPLQHGFEALIPGHFEAEETIVEGHYTILKGCFDYMKIKELDRLVHARQQDTKSSDCNSWRSSLGIHRKISIENFGSAASSCSSHASFDHQSPGRATPELVPGRIEGLEMLSASYLLPKIRTDVPKWLNWHSPPPPPP